MHVTLMKGKIHCASVTDADLHPDGAISIDRSLQPHGWPYQETSSSSWHTPPSTTMRRERLARTS